MTSAGAARTRLIDATLEALSAQGPPGLSARALGERAGMSPSAVNYHFGGRERLLAEAYGVAAAAAQAWRRDRLACAPPSAPPEALAGWMTAMVADLCGRPEVVLAMREFRQMARRAPALQAVARQDQADADCFWTEVAERCGLTAAAGPALCDFASGGALVHGPAADWARELPWLSQTCLRLGARLAGRRTALPGWDGWRADLERRAAERVGAWSPPTSEAALRMLRAAVEILGQHGLEGLTHRAVAAAAETSLANATHHFPSRTALVQGAFRYLHRQATEQGATRRRAQAQANVTPAQFADGFADFLLNTDGEVHPGTLALEELVMAAGREPGLKALSEQLRTARGEGSAEALADMSATGHPPDRLDAHVVSTVLMGSIRGVYGLEPAARNAWLRPRARANLEALFG